MGMMETDVTPPSWFEFLLDRNLLEKHLQTNNPDPSPTTLLSHFILNAEKSTAESAEATASQVEGAFSIEDTLNLSYKQKKSRILRLISLQTAAFLNWDLDMLAKMHVTTQHALMKHIIVTAQTDSDKDSDSPKEFLRVLYHRWVIKILQSHNSFSKTTRYVQQADQFTAFESVWKQLSEEESLSYLKNCLTKLELSGDRKIKLPNVRTFDVDRTPDWSTGTEIERSAFDSMIHLEMGIFLLHKGNTLEAVSHFKNQKIPTENFPFLKISRTKLEGYLRAVGLLNTFDQQLEDSKVIPRSLDHGKMVEIATLIRKGQTIKLKRMIDVKLDTQISKGQDRLNPNQKEKEDGAFVVSGDSINVQWKRFTMEKRLIETTDSNEIKELLMELHIPANSTANSNSRMFSQLFSEWELPIPVQHATLNLPTGAFQDYIYILVAKSRQLLISKVFTEARKMLLMAKSELHMQLQKSVVGGMTPYFYTIGKLAKMMDWEILLIDITQFVSEYPLSSDKSGFSDLKARCKDCLTCLQSPGADVNPRSEIVENILVTFINLGEYSYVADFDQMQSQRWPFVEFIALLARVCQDLFIDRKDTSSNYRDLWSAVLPIFTNNSSGTGGNINSKKQLANSVSNKPAILSSRSALTWVIERSCSQPLLSVWVSLLARLHNHILDDVGLQIQTEFLYIWPNILDDVTASSTMELKGGRVSGSSKLNSKHIRDFLFSLLERATRITHGGEMVVWLRCLGDVNLASGAPSLAMKCYVEYLAMCTDFFEKPNTPHWNDGSLFKRMIKCCEMLGCFTQAVVLCQMLSPEVDYSMAFGMAQEKTTNDSSDSLYGFIWDLTILEFLINLHTKKNELAKRQQAIKVMGLLELNSNNNEEIQREAMCLRRSQFMRTLAKHYIFV